MAIRCSSEGALTRLAMARARAFGSCGGISMPDTPSSTISGIGSDFHSRCVACRGSAGRKPYFALC
jgi:hypothetical protein